LVLVSASPFSSLRRSLAVRESWKPTSARIARTSFIARTDARGAPTLIDAQAPALNIQAGITTPESFGSKQT
jgi:hypothetical protein